MFAHERQQRITALLKRRGRLTVQELQEALRVSPATLRRDLAALARTDAVVRTHGGVVHPAVLHGEHVFQQRERVAAGIKHAIAMQAARHAGEHAVVYIDAGTTTLAVARILLARRDVTIITNNVPLLMMGRSDGAQVLATGGVVRLPSQALVSGLGLEWMRHMHVDTAYIGASGLDAADGASVTSLEEAAMKRAAMERADTSILVCDRRKWGRPATVQFAPWRAFRVWVTDAVLARAARAALRRRGVRVEQVDTEDERCR